MKRWVRGGAALVVVVVFVALLGLLRVRSGPGLPTGDRTLPGLEGSVEVLWDEYGIPQVYAGSDRDALFVQGYLHATHRLWQVELFRRVAAGRLSEVFGDATVADDRFLRTLGMDRAAARNADLLTAEERVLLQAYASGLNSAVENWGGWLPPEFLILGIEPEPYTLEDVLALEKIMAFDLSNYNQALGLARVYARLGEAGLDRVRPRYPEAGLTILESAGVEPAPEEPWLGASRAGAPASASASPAVASASPEAARTEPPGAHPEPTSSPAHPGLLALLDGAVRPSGLRGDSSQGDLSPRPLFDFVAAVNAVRASNSWVLGPERSASGKPLLANDMHLALNRPTIWYLMGLHAPGLDVVGMSLPGTAGIVAGRTAGVAWGFTNAMLDDMELFMERADPEDPSRYLTPEGSAPFAVRTEVIQIRGAAPDTIEVRSTRHGPVITPVAAGAGDEHLALRWVGHEASRTPAALLGMNRAGNVDEFLEALEGFTDPHQNVVFADTAGTWGYWMAGRVPIRPGGSPPAGPVPGWTGEFDWQGWLPFRDHPHAINPPSGYVATANNRQGRGAAGARVSLEWQPPFRAQRIADLIEARPRHDAASLHAIQMDVVTEQGRAFSRQAAAAYRAAGSDTAAALLQEWDGSATHESVATALFEVWYAELDRLLTETLLGAEGGFLPYGVVIEHLRTTPESPLTVEAARASLAAMEGLPELREIRSLRLDHPLSAVPALQAIFGFATEGIPVRGTGETVAPAHARGVQGAQVVTWGASQRHVSDLADLDRGGFVLPGGQSGYPAADHAADQLPLWLEGGLIPLPMSRPGAEARTAKRLTLNP